jgi:hypothetical protein
MKKNIPIGYDNFQQVREGNYYFVDKSLYIKEIIRGGQVALCTRPRRFGKTLNLSMLEYFFDINLQTRHLFEGLNITQEPEFEQHLNKYPVISLSLKGIKKDSWKASYEVIVSTFQELYENHRYLLTSDKVSKEQKNVYQLILSGKAAQTQIERGLYFLSDLLYHHYGKKVVILIDEYDSPVYVAYEKGYYAELMSFLRPVFEFSLKNNKYLERGVVTGILRIVKESLFSGINNLTVFSILDNDGISDKFGFTEIEVKELLAYYELSDNFEWVKKWYDGYYFGEYNVFNTWSVLNFVHRPKDGLVPYWVNTSGNELLKKLMLSGANNIKEKMQPLLNGEEIIKELSSELTFSDLDMNEDAIFALLTFSGYLQVIRLPKNPEDAQYKYRISIPNIEIKHVYKTTIQTWLNVDMKLLNQKFDDMLRFLTLGNIEPFQHYFEKFLLASVSAHDTKEPDTENFYHALVLGMLARLDSEYHIKSNHEAGYGRYDICLIPKKGNFTRYYGQKGIIIELKLANKKTSLAAALKAAATQMQENRYEMDLLAQEVTDIVRICIAVKGKRFEMKAV